MVAHYSIIFVIFYLKKNKLTYLQLKGKIERTHYYFSEKSFWQLLLLEINNELILKTDMAELQPEKFIHTMRETFK